MFCFIKHLKKKLFVKKTKKKVFYILIFSFFSFFFLYMPRSKNVSRRKARKAVRKTSKSSVFGYGRKDQRNARNQAGVKDVQVTAPGSALEFRAPRMYLRGGPFQQAIYTKLRYTESFVIATNNITGLSESPVRYNLGSLFDPTLAVGGHQPYGFDQLAAVYKSYCVYGVRVIITSDASNVSTTALNGAVMCLRVASSSTLTASLVSLTPEDFREKAGALVWDGEQQGGKLDLGYMSIADIEGVEKTKVMNDNVYTAAVTASPLLSPEIQFYLSSNTGTGAALGALRRYSILIDFYVKMYGTTAMTQS